MTAEQQRMTITDPQVMRAQGASMVGYFLGGLLLEWLAPRTMVALAGGVGLAVVALVAYPVRRAVRRERTAVPSVRTAPLLPRSPERTAPVVATVRS